MGSATNAAINGSGTARLGIECIAVSCLELTQQGSFAPLHGLSDGATQDCNGFPRTDQSSWWPASRRSHWAKNNFEINLQIVSIRVMGRSMLKRLGWGTLATRLTSKSMDTSFWNRPLLPLPLQPPSLFRSAWSSPNCNGLLKALHADARRACVLRAHLMSCMLCMFSLSVTIVVAALSIVAVLPLHVSCRRHPR